MGGVDADLAGEQALHQPFFLLLEGTVFLLKEFNFVICYMQNSRN